MRGNGRSISSSAKRKESAVKCVMSLFVVATLAIGALGAGININLWSDDDDSWESTSGGVSGENYTYGPELNGPKGKYRLAYTINAGKATLVGWDNSPGYRYPSGNLVVPSAIGSYPVVAIGGSAFNSCPGITSVTVAGSVESVGGSAFYYCKELTSVTLQSGVKTIGNSAFQGSSKLNTISLSNTLTSIGTHVFQNTNLNSITFPASLLSIGDYSFYNSRIASFTIPQNVSSIGLYALTGTYTTSIDVVAGNQQFSSSGGVLYDKAKTTLVQYPAGKTDESFTIPTTVTKIGQYAFMSASKVKTVTITQNVKTIDSNAFYNSSGLTSISIPGTVLTVGDSAFYNCSNLTSLSIGQGVTAIGAKTFQSCNKIVSVNIPSSVISIGDNAFSSCTSITSITLNSGLQTIGKSAFSSCSKISTITIPGTVTSIGSGAFSGCTALTEILVSGGSYFKSTGGVLFSYDSKTLVMYPTGKTGTTYTIPTQVTKIGDYAFARSMITSITIPGNVAAIGDYAFQSCGFATITIPGNVKTIGDYAFQSCGSLVSVVLQQGVQTFGNHAFGSCAKLESISLPTSLTRMGYWSFLNCTKLNNVVIPEGITKIESLTFQGCKGLTNVTLPSTLVTIESQAFNGAGLTSVNIPNGVTTIGSNAFSSCQLTSATIPASVTSIDSSSFRNSTLKEFKVVGSNSKYSSLDGVLYNNDKTVLIQYPAGKTDLSFSIPAGVVTVNSLAFYDCKNLTTVTIPASVDTITGNSFYTCSSLLNINVDSGNGKYTSVDGVLYSKDKSTLMMYPSGRTGSSFTIDSSTNVIGQYAFSYCDNLVDVVIPGNITKIESYAFHYCNNIKTLTVPENVADIGNYSFYYCNSLKDVYFTGAALPTFSGGTYGNSTPFKPGVIFYSHGDKGSTWWTGSGMTFSDTYTGVYYDLTLNGSNSAAGIFDNAGPFSIPSMLAGNSVPISQEKLEELFDLSNGFTPQITTDGGVTWIDLRGYVMTQDITATGRWAFTASFSLNGGTGTAPDSIGGIGNITLPDAPAVTKANYYFNGWNTQSDGKGVRYAPGSQFDLSGNTTLYADWAQYTVSYNSEGGSGDVPPTKGFGNTAISNSVFTKNGYYQSGWSTLPDGAGTIYAPGATINVTQDMVLHAVWSQYTVTYDSDGGTGSTEPTKGYGDTVLSMGSGMSKDGFTLGGWSTMPNGAGTVYTLGGTLNINQNTVLYAVWSQYGITYNVNGADTGSNFTQGGSGNVTLSDGSGISRMGYYLSGWNTLSDGNGQHYGLGDPFTLSSSVVLFAEWSQYTIEYDGNDGSGSVPDGKWCGDMYISDGSGFTRGNYYLSGWNTRADGLGQSYSLGQGIDLDSDLKLFAIWSQYTITYKCNTDQGLSTDHYCAGGVSLSDGSHLSNPGYVFAGWNTSADGSGTAYNEGTSVHIVDDLVLFAQWIAGPNNVGDGEGDGPLGGTWLWIVLIIIVIAVIGILAYFLSKRNGGKGDIGN